jgi:hypothetical protein
VKELKRHMHVHATVTASANDVRRAVEASVRSDHSVEMVANDHFIRFRSKATRRDDVSAVGSVGWLPSVFRPIFSGKSGLRVSYHLTLTIANPTVSDHFMARVVLPVRLRFSFAKMLLNARRLSRAGLQ